MLNRVTQYFKKSIIKLEKYIILAQERNHLFKTDEIIPLLRERKESELNHKFCVLKYKIDAFIFNVKGLLKSRNIDFFFEIKKSYDETLETVLEFLKITSIIQNEAALNSLYEAIAEDWEIEFNRDRFDEDFQQKNEMYYMTLDILFTNYLSSK